MTRGVKIFVIILLTILISILIICWNRNHCWGCRSYDLNGIDFDAKQEVNNLFNEENENLVLSLGSQNIAELEQGTENFGFVVGYTPDDPRAWGNDNEGCMYNIEADPEKGTCEAAGWTNPEKDILTGTKEVIFDEIDDGKGYALIKMNIPKKIPPCLQKFEITVDCEGYSHETTTEYFYIEVLKRGLF